MADDYFSALMNFADEIEEAYTFGKDVKAEGEIDKIVFVGMGGSAISGDIARSYLDIRVPVFVCKSYDLPEFVDHRTLLIAISYSGNTEETLSAVFNSTFRKNTKSVVITSGGRLAQSSRVVVYT